MSTALTASPPLSVTGGDRRVRFLCVDDAPDAADTLKAVTELYGYEAAACYDGPSAITTAEQFQPDLCLLDLNLPGMDGIALARWLSHQAGGRPVGHGSGRVSTLPPAASIARIAAWEKPCARTVSGFESSPRASTFTSPRLATRPRSRSVSGVTSAFASNASRVVRFTT